MDIALSEIRLQEEEMEAITSVLQSGWLSMGPQTHVFEEEFALKLGMSIPATAVSSGTAALHTAMSILDLNKDDEVLVPSMTFIATAATVAMAGGKPVFVDSTSERDFNMDLVSMQKKINSRTKAVVVVHYGGFPAAMNDIIQVARERGLYVIEDVAHGPFVQTNNGMLGTLGDIGCFSFFSNKNMTTGEGGMIVCRSENLMRRARQFRSHGFSTTSWNKSQGRAFTSDVEYLGLNYRTTDIASALGRKQLQQVDRYQAKRQQLVHLYRSLLGNSPILNLPFLHHEVHEGACHLMPVVLSDKVNRDELVSFLKKAGIQTSVHYPPCHLFQPFMRSFDSQAGDCPVAESIARKQMTLPLHPHMTGAQVSYICDKLNEFMETSDH